MADDGNQENGNRATVALVSAQIAEVKAIVEGHADLTRAGFVDVQRQLDDVAGLPAAYAALAATVSAQGERIVSLEDDDRSDDEWFRSNLPAFAVSIAALAIAYFS